jgi:hypothetical protein
MSGELQSIPYSTADHIRSYALGRLILGTTFFWWDQVAYTVGVGLVVPVDLLLRRK